MATQPRAGRPRTRVPWADAPRTPVPTRLDALRAGLREYGPLGRLILDYVDAAVAEQAPRPVETGDYISVQAAAKRLGRHPATIRRWAAAGLIPSVRVAA